MKYNVKAFRRLIKKYEEVTIEKLNKIQKRHEKYQDVTFSSEIAEEYAKLNGCILCNETGLLANNSLRSCDHCLYTKEMVHPLEPVCTMFGRYHYIYTINHDDLNIVVDLMHERAKQLKELLIKLKYKI